MYNEINGFKTKSMKTTSVNFRNALKWAMQMSTRVFMVLLLLTICQIASIQAQTVPGITWTQQYGTTNIDQSRGISAEGNIYMAGNTYGTFPGQTNYGSCDAYFVKYDPAGNQLWVRQFGTSSSSDAATGIAVDGSGVYVTGYVGAALPGQTYFGSLDAFIRKYDHSGNELWTRQFGTTGQDQAADAVGVDATGVYVIGRTGGSFPGYTNAGGNDIFIAKYSLEGTQLWLLQRGTAGADYCSGIIVDASGFYISGYDNSLGTSNVEAFIAKYSLAGSEVWSSRFGTTGSDYVNEISADETALYVSGYTNGTFPGQSYAGGSYDTWVAKYERSGNQLWIREFGTTGADWGWGLCASTSGVYITGYTDGAFPGKTNSGSNDIFTAKYNKNGDLLWILETGSPSGDYAYTISVVSSNAYVNGYTNGTLPGQTGVGGADAFLLKLLVNLPPVADCGDGQLKIVTETVQLDGSGSSDQDGDAVTYAWSFVSRPAGSTAVLSSSTTVNPTFDADAAGDYVIQLIANDGTVNSDPCLVTITVQTPQEATQDLIGDVQELVAAGVLNQGQGNALTAKLQAAIQKMNQGNYNAAINILNAFINQVNAFYNSGILTEEQAIALIAPAERIIDCLERLMLKDGGMNPGGDLSSAENLQTWNNPNPFNNSTTINYSLPADLVVTLKVYDSRGKEVSLLVNELQSRGTHAVTFMADGLSSGIYYYRIQAGNASVTKKLILVR